MTALQNQSVLVTGANRGMGRHYVTQLLDRGVAKVYAAAIDSESVTSRVSGTTRGSVTSIRLASRAAA